MNRLCLRPACLLLAIVPFVAGCGADGPLSPVHGTVFYNGKPLTCGTVVFTPNPARGCTGPQGSAEIQPDGTFNLRTGEREGAVPGWHRVTILAIEAPAKNPDAAHFSIPRSLVPEKYRDPVQSGLACEVLPGKPNGINFNLD